MEINHELNTILMAAFEEAKIRKHEYLMPEHILFATLHNDLGRDIIEGSGGDVDSLIHRIEDFFGKHISTVDSDEPIQSLGFKSVLERAIWHTTSAQKEELEVSDVLVSIFDETESFAAYFLQEEGITRYSLLNFISHGVRQYPPEGDFDSDASEEQEADQGGKSKKSPGKKAVEAYTTE